MNTMKESLWSSIRPIARDCVILVLTWLSKQTLKKYKPKIVAITGSVGKTTAKDAIFAAIAPHKNARKSEKSFNSEFGIPLTILGCRNAWRNPFLWLDNILQSVWRLVFTVSYPEWLVLEVGADRPGDIKSVSEWLSPDIVVITRLPNVPVHVEFFPSPADLANEKMHLARALKGGGLLVLNGDDDEVLSRGRELNMRTITYGVSRDADVQASDVLFESSVSNGVELPTGIVFDLQAGGEKAPVNIPNAAGKHIALACAAAAAVAQEIGIPLADAARDLSRSGAPLGRLRLIPGIKETMIVDDSYNASPAAADEALDALSAMRGSGKKIAALGDMLELGSFSVDEHRRIGKRAAEVADILITVGMRARGFAEGALDGGMDEENIFQYEDSRQAGKEAESLIGPGDIILAKGSQGIRMERFVEEIMRDPEQKADLLVRQDKEWERR